jgi:TPR repeat protein
MEAQAQGIRGVEQTRVLGEELLQAKARVAQLAAEKAQLAAELKMRDDALQAKEVLLQTIINSKDEAIGAKHTLPQANESLLLSKDALLQAKDSELRLLHADIARLSAGCAAGGAARRRQPAPAPPANVDAAAQGEALFQEGQRLYGEQRFSEAAERWGRAALLRHGPSHAHLSDMLIDGRAGVARDLKRAFKLAKAGAALGCAHSKGALGCCYVMGHGVAYDEARGLALGRESAAAGSCFGQFVVGVCYNVGWGGIAQDDAEAVRLYSLAAAQGDALAQTSLARLGAYL